MFSLIFCFLPIFLGFYHILLIKKRKSLSWNIKKGEICYHCKESINIDNDIILGRLLDTNNFSCLCVSCNRDRKIEQVKHPYLKFKHQFLKFIVSDNFSKFNIIYLISVFSLIVTDIILLFFNTGFRLWLVYGSMNFIYYFVTIYRTIYTTTKKTSD